MWPVVISVASLLLSGCASYTVRQAAPKGTFFPPRIAAPRADLFSGIIRELASRNIQVGAADQQSGVITVPNLTLDPTYFDCNQLMVDGRPGYRFTAAGASLQFIVEGDASSSFVRATMQFGLVAYVSDIGVQRVGREVCYSSHLLEEMIVSRVREAIEKRQ